MLLGADGRALVSDFGLARAGAEPGAGRPLDEAEATAELERPLLEAPLTRTGALLGTPAYMSPEQFRGEMATARSDVFAFCVVVWETIFGQRPFTGSTIAALVSAIEAGTITPPPRTIRIPTALRRQLLRGLARQPGDRHASMGELLAALEGASRSALPRRLLYAAGVVFTLVTGVTAASYMLTRPLPQTEAERAAASFAENPAQYMTTSQGAAYTAPIEAPPPRTMSRDEFTRVLGSRDAVDRQARVMPSIKDGVFGGFKLYGLRPDTPLKELGFFNGDMLVALDERTLTPAMAWETEMTAASADGEVTLLVKRKGELLTFVFRIVDSPAAAR